MQSRDVAEKTGSLEAHYDDLWQKKDLTPHQLLVHDIRLENWRPNTGPSLEIRERVASELMHPAAALTYSARLIKAAEGASNPIEYQQLSRLEEQWGWVSDLRLQRIQQQISDPEGSAVCRWIHVSSKFPQYLRGFLWALSDLSEPGNVAASLRLLEQCRRKNERFSKHGKHFTPFWQSLATDNKAGSGNSQYPFLLSVPFLDWSVTGQTPPLRFQVDKKEGQSSGRSPTHPLRTILQHFYRLEETRDREKDQVHSKYRPWTTDRELDLRVRSWFGHHPTALNVDELWILAIDANHVVSFSANQSWKSRWPPLQLTSRISDVSFRNARNSMKFRDDPQHYNALTHCIVCLNGALGMLHRSFWEDIILCLTDRYAGYLGHLQYRIYRSPSTRLVTDLLQLQEELNIITKLMQQQLDLLGVMSQQVEAWQAGNDKALSHLTDLTNQLVDNLQAELIDLRELLENTNTLVNRTIQLVNIRLEDHGKAIIVFTVVTIIFLPLNFVSSFFGMNVADIRNMQSTQGLFWIVAACVTIGVVATAVFLAFSGSALMERYSIWRGSRQRARARTQAEAQRPSTIQSRSFRIFNAGTT